MVNKKFWLVIPVMMLVFGLTAADYAFGQDAALNGRWRSPKSRYGGFENDLCQYTFLAGNYEILKDSGSAQFSFEKGTYTTNDKGVIFLKVTHHRLDEDDNKWYTKDEIIKFLKSDYDMTDAEIKEDLEDEEMFIDRSFVYSIENILGFQTLQLYQGREKFTYHKQ
jgi:hypothetical protein